VYPDLDLVAITSLNEGTPVSLIEAMASGRAVVSTDVGGVKDVIEDGVNGILVRSGDAAGLAGRLKELLADKDKRERMGRSGRSLVKERYSSDRLVREMKALYEACLKGHR